MADEEIKILVKKPDGSFVHVPLSEIQKRNRPAPAAVASSAPVMNVVPKPEPVKPAIKPVVKAEVKNNPVSPKFEAIENARLEKEVPAIVQPTPIAKYVPTEQKNPVKNNPVNTPIKPVQSVQAKVAVAKSEPVKLSVVPEKNDLGSLLDEELPNANKIAPLTSESREKQVDEIIKNISFKIPPGNNSRVKTIVQLFLKEIRGEEETLEILRRPEIDGGVGLSEEQANEVVEKSRRTTVQASANVFVPSLKTAPKITIPVPNGLAAIQKTKVNSEFKSEESKRFEAELPAVVIKSEIPKPMPVSNVKPIQSAPVQAPIVSLPKPVEAVNTRKSLEEQITKATLSELPGTFKINSDRSKTTMHDVKAAPSQMGPVDEIRYFSLVDFRRLAGDPVEAANRLKQKFLNLHEESVMFYFEALDAWKISPLYHDYINLVSEALKKRLPLAKIAVDKSRIQISEVNALIKMEKELG